MIHRIPAYCDIYFLTNPAFLDSGGNIGINFSPLGMVKGKAFLCGGKMDLVWRLFPFYVVLMLLIQLVPVRINLYFLRENKDDFLSLRVSTFFSLIRFNVEIPVLTQKTPLDLTMEAELKAGEDELVREKKGEWSILDIEWEKVRAYLAYIQNNRRRLWFLLRFLTRSMLVEKLVFRVRVGTDDAALTGILGGIYWTLAGTLTALAQQWLRLKEQPVLAFNPDFTAEPVFAAKFDGVVSFRIGHLTIGSMILIVTKLQGGRA
jgi:hypothetical protein